MFKDILALTLYFGFPVFIRSYLKSDISLLFLISLIFIRSASIILYLGYPSKYLSFKFKRIFKIIFFLSGLFFAVVILAGLLITPFSAYKIWFEAAARNLQHGVVSNLFVLIPAFLISGIDFYTAGIFLPFILLGIILSGLAMLVFQTPDLYLLFLGSTGVFFIYRAVRFSERGKRFNRLMLYVLFAGFTALVAFGTSLTYSPKGSELVDTKLQPGLRKAVVALFPRFPLLYGMPGYGYSFNEKRLGGTPVLASAPIFKLNVVSADRKNSGRPIYLRTAVFNDYTGKEWRNTLEDTHKKFNWKLTDISHASLKIKLLLEYYYLLPHTLETRGIAVERADKSKKNDALQLTGSMDTGFVFKEPVKTGDIIYIKESSEQTAKPQSLLKPEQVKRYLQVPDELPEDVRKLAEKLGASAWNTKRRNVSQAAMKTVSPAAMKSAVLDSIESYLSSNYTYSLKVSPPGKGEDFISDFLFSKKTGYCVHFASAFVLLARLNGIPARYVTGFLVIPSGLEGMQNAGEDGVIVTGLSAHAWPEVWLPGRGWTVWEATPAVNLTNFGHKNSSLFYRYQFLKDRLTEKQLLAILRINTVPVQKGEKTKKPLFQGLITFYRLAILSSIILFSIAALIFFKTIKFQFYLLVFTFQTAIRKNILGRLIFGFLIYLSGGISGAGVYLLKRFALVRSSGYFRELHSSGWTSWGENIKKRTGAHEGRMNHVIDLILLIAYSNGTVNERDIRYLFLFYRKYCRKTKSKILFKTKTNSDTFLG